MTKKRIKLGRGLEALLGEAALDQLSGQESADQLPNESLRELPVEAIRPGPWQPRRHFDQQQLAELADSIRAQGILQPVLVSAADDGYTLIAGERRWRAAQLAGIHTIPALVREANDLDSGLMALIENIQRSDLGALELARGLQQLQERQLSHQAIASALGISRSSVTNLMRLLGLPQQVKNLLESGELDMGHARALLGLEADQQLGVAQAIVKRGLSVRETEQLVKQHKQGKVAKPAKQSQDPNIVALTNRLSELLATRVELKQHSGGKGQLVIGYNSSNQLDALLAKLAPELHDE